MATKANRGTKRSCQNGSCGAKFYDLNRDPINCPVCSSRYVVTAPTAVAAGDVAAAHRRAAKKPEFIAPTVAGEGPEIEADDALVEVEGEGAEEPVAAGEEETFLVQEEDEAGDVTGIIGGATGGEEEG